MPITLTTVTGPILGPDGAAIVGATINFVMARRDREGDALILPAPVAATTDEAGELSADLWANVEGYAGTWYEVRILYGAQGGRHISGRCNVPASGPVALADIMETMPPDPTDDLTAKVNEARTYRDTAEAAAEQTAEDREATAADRVATGQDRVATAADREQTGLDRAAAESAAGAASGHAATASGAAGTATAAAGAASTAAGAAIAAAEQTAEDRVATSEDRTQTGLDAAATAADRLATGSDRTETGADRTQTAADRVQTGLDREAAEDAASTASGHAATASASAGTATTQAGIATDAAALATSAADQTADDRIATGIDRDAAAISASTASTKASEIASYTIASAVHAFPGGGVSVAVGGYYLAARTRVEAPAHRFLLSALAGSVGGTATVELLINGTPVTSPIAVVVGTPVVTALEGVTVPVDSLIVANVLTVTNVTSLWMQVN